jgi:hypothetical protein
VQVKRLIMIAPPNHGSQLAYFGSRSFLGKTVRAAWQRPPDSRGWRLLQLVLDSAVQTPDELQPGSEFLRKLNGHDRNPSVKYSILLGTDGPLSAADRAVLARVAERLLKRNSVTRRLASELDREFRELVELERGQGDGVVAVKRGRLAGVRDVEVLDFRHTAINQLSQSGRHAALEQAVLRRLPSP